MCLENISLVSLGQEMKKLKQTNVSCVLHIKPIL